MSATNTESKRAEGEEEGNGEREQAQAPFRMHFAEEKFMFCRLAAQQQLYALLSDFVPVFALRFANVYHHLFIQLRVEFSFELLLHKWLCTENKSHKEKRVFLPFRNRKIAFKLQDIKCHFNVCILSMHTIVCVGVSESEREREFFSVWLANAYWILKLN